MPRDAGVDHLWAPWRMTYIAKADKVRGCLFCRTDRQRDDRSQLVLARRPHAFLMLNRFPYNPGHLMVAVTRHAARGVGRWFVLRLDGARQRAGHPGHFRGPRAVHCGRGKCGNA